MPKHPFSVATGFLALLFFHPFAMACSTTNHSDRFRKDDDVRWQCGVPPKGNANFAWVQHFIHHLARSGPGTSGGMAGFVLANGSMSSIQSGDCNARSARREWATNSQGLGSQRDIRRAAANSVLDERPSLVQISPQQ